jgi:hypothetical protein
MVRAHKRLRGRPEAENNSKSVQCAIIAVSPAPTKVYLQSLAPLLNLPRNKHRAAVLAVADRQCWHQRPQPLFHRSQRRYKDDTTDSGGPLLGPQHCASLWANEAERLMFETNLCTNSCFTTQYPRFMTETQRTDRQDGTESTQISKRHRPPVSRHEPLPARSLLSFFLLPR